jgi:predicted amidohydrolase
MAGLRVAAVQAKSVASDFPEKWAGVDVEHALSLVDQAVAQGATLICFPELYPLVGLDELKAKALEHRVHIIAGMAEGTPEHWYNTSVIISSEGEVVGRQTKNYPTAGEVDNGVIAGDRFEVFETKIGRFGIVICADFAFFSDGVDKCRQDGADIIFNPAVWFALAEGYPHAVAGRHLEYSVPIVGVNVARPDKARALKGFPPAGGFSTVCVPPPVKDMDELWKWFCDKPTGIDTVSDFIHTAGRDEQIIVVDVDIEAVRKFPGYFSSRVTERSQARNVA